MTKSMKTINTPEELQSFFDKRAITCLDTVEIPVIDLQQWIVDTVNETNQEPNSHAATPRTHMG